MGKKSKANKPVVEEETTTESGFSQFDLDERILKVLYIFTLFQWFIVFRLLVNLVERSQHKYKKA